MLLWPPGMLYAHVLQEEALSHHIQSEEPIPSLMFQLVNFIEDLM